MAASDLLIDVHPDGMVEFIYSDDLAPLAQEGRPTIRRVSDVEPDESGRWWADMARVGGPRLGPFALRSEALAAEMEWLRRR